MKKLFKFFSFKYAFFISVAIHAFMVIFIWIFSYPKNSPSLPPVNNLYSYVSIQVNSHQNLNTTPFQPRKLNLNKLQKKEKSFSSGLMSNNSAPIVNAVSTSIINSASDKKISNPQLVEENLNLFAHQIRQEILSQLNSQLFENQNIKPINIFIRIETSESQAAFSIDNASIRTKIALKKVLEQTFNDSKLIEEYSKKKGQLKFPLQLSLQIQVSQN